MIVYSRITVGSEMVQSTQKGSLNRFIKDGLYHEMKREILSKTEVSEEYCERTNSVEYTAEVAVLSKEEYIELKAIEGEYYKLMGVRK